MNELTLRRTKVEWLKIIELALKKQDWGKSYLLYTYGRTTITCTMESFNFKLNEAQFEIEVNYEDRTLQYNNKTKLKYWLNNYTKGDFKGLVSRTLTRHLSSITRQETERKAENLCDLENYSSCDIDYDYIEGTEYEAEWDRLNDLLGEFGNSTHIESAMDSIREQVADDLNKPRENWIEDCTLNNRMVIEGFEQIKEDLEQ